MTGGDGKSPMERFGDLAAKVFSKDLKRVTKPKEDAEEIMEGGVELLSGLNPMNRPVLSDAKRRVGRLLMPASLFLIH